jgi:hypothetical protein
MLKINQRYSMFGSANVSNGANKIIRAHRDVKIKVGAEMVLTLVLM